MKTQISIMFLAAIFTTAIFAANEHDHADNAQEGGAMASGMMMGVMNKEQMMQMHQHMQEMQALMTRLNEENDPDVRGQLMQEHMASMQDAMKLMGGAKMGMSGNGDMKSMNMEERMAMMQNQMGMMNMMMEQMMNHFSQDSNDHE